MKYLVLSLVICYAFATSLDESKKLIKNEIKIFQKCAADGNLTESAVEGIYKNSELPETRAIKCLLGCHMKGMGYLSDDGIIDWRKWDEINKIEYVDPSQAKKALEITAVCKKSVPQTLGNICDAGYEAAKCFLEEAKKRDLPILGPEAAQ